MEKNPLAKETFMTRMKKGKEKESEKVNTGRIEARLIGMNNGMPICAQACACCWDKPVPQTYEDICIYIAKRSKTGHTSILEHSNFVIYLSVGVFYTEDLMEVLDACHYLHISISMSKDNTKWHVIIGGSYRGYGNIYMEVKNMNNRVLDHISSLLYTYANSAAFEDICAYGLLDKERFSNIEPDHNFKLLSTFNEIYSTDLFDIINIDNLKIIYLNLKEIDEEIKISMYDLIKFGTVTVLFKNMSRTCTHQLVRHRNAITQESQRYVDYSSAVFSSPEMFKPDKYDKDYKYPVNFGPSPRLKMTLSEIGEAMCGIYNILSNKAAVGGDHVLMKEDARAFLPSNVQCRKIFVTFTYKNLIKFLSLREAPAAQAEIRMYARALGEAFRDITGLHNLEDFDKPKSLFEGETEVDEDEGIVEEKFEISEEAYIHATGLDKELEDESTTEET